MDYANRVAIELGVKRLGIPIGIGIVGMDLTRVLSRGHFVRLFPGALVAIPVTALIGYLGARALHALGLLPNAEQLPAVIRRSLITEYLIALLLGLVLGALP